MENDLPQKTDAQNEEDPGADSLSLDCFAPGSSSSIGANSTPRRCDAPAYREQGPEAHPRQSWAARASLRLPEGRALSQNRIRREVSCADSATDTLRSRLTSKPNPHSALKTPARMTTQIPAASPRGRPKMTERAEGRVLLSRQENVLAKSVLQMRGRNASVACRQVGHRNTAMPSPTRSSNCARVAERPDERPEAEAEIGELKNPPHLPKGLARCASFDAYNTPDIQTTHFNLRKNRLCFRQILSHHVPKNAAAARGAAVNAVRVVGASVEPSLRVTDGV